MNWTTEMPTEPGWYWFYGQRYGERECELVTVHVWKISNGAVARVCGAAFMYESELGEIRWFQPIIEPELP